jgi:hypothetical protein
MRLSTILIKSKLNHKSSRIRKKISRKSKNLRMILQIQIRHSTKATKMLLLAQIKASLHRQEKMKRHMLLLTNLIIPIIKLKAIMQKNKTSRIKETTKENTNNLEREIYLELQLLLETLIKLLEILVRTPCQLFLLQVMA